MSGIRLLTLTGPAIALVFTAVFLGIWNHWRKLRYLLWFAAAFLLFSVAALSQILMIPQGNGPNTIVSCLLYVSAVIVFSDSLLLRLQLRPNYLLNFAISALIVGGIWYFFYVNLNLDVRVYILNFGLAILLLVTALRLGRAAKSKVDRAVYWTLLVFAIQFFPRTILSAGYVGSRRDVVTLTQSPFWVWLNFSFIIFTVLLGLVLLAAVVADIVGILHHKANTDPLTGMLNRRGLEQFAEHQFSAMERRRRSLIIFDIDNFKSINDSYGHHEGDAVLTQVASLVRENTRQSDAAARLGGEEFVILLADTDGGDAYALAERLRSQIARTRFGIGVLSNRTVTASFGVIEFRAGEGLDEAIRRADEMMYAAKRSGKNKTLVGWTNTKLAAAPGGGE